MGVGATEAQDPTVYNSPDVPSEVEIPVIDVEKCRELYGADGTDTKDINEFRICFHKDGGGLSSCFVDSGGPAFKLLENDEQILIGITSEGLNDNCTGPTAGNLYMDVFKMESWIRETTGISQ